MKTQDTNHFGFGQNIDFKQILTNPILDIAAHFWEDERYQAFKICYRSMRAVDDLIDNRKAATRKISKIEKRQFKAAIKDWVEALETATPYDSFQNQLVETRAKFQIPFWPWQKLAVSMLYDLHHDGFSTYPAFIKYAEGAAVSPAAIFMHLCGVFKEYGSYRSPHFDIRKAARPLALFCYFVHIVRDFQKDQYDNLTYFADSLIAENGLNRSMLKEIAAGGKINTGFRNLTRQYYTFTERYRRKARRTLDSISAHLEPRYRLSLEIIYGLYSQIFERIDVTNGKFTMVELCPSPEEVQSRINQIISIFELSNEKE